MSRSVLVVASLLTVALGLGSSCGGGSDALDSCCNTDSPECSCFDDTAAWKPSGPYIQDMALTTLGTSESCLSDGGKPYYQMRLGLDSRESAQFFACALQENWFYIDPEFAVRDAWCSESISYWHRHAQIPYETGFRNSEWLLDWQIGDTYGLETFYRTEEDGGGPARWIHWNDIDYEDFQPGVNAPVPGSYVLLRRIRGGSWDGRSHSMMIDEMTVHQLSTGEVLQVELTILEGNWDNAVIDTKYFADLYDYTPAGTSSLSDNRRLRGFGVDLDSRGEPIYDHDRLHVVVVDLPFVRPPRLPDPSDLLWETHYAPLVPELSAFGQALRKNQGANVTPSVQTLVLMGIPDGVTSQWKFPENLDQLAPQGLEVVIDLLAEHPLPLKTLLLNWVGTSVPQGYQVHFADRSAQYQAAKVPNLDEQSIQFRPDGQAAMPIPVTLSESGATVRYVRFTFPPGSLTGVKSLFEIRFLFDWGPGQDDPTPSAQ